jgi:hypothetical protein
MAEATNRPQTAGTADSTAERSEASPLTPPAEPEPYRPLSILALAGFIVAVLYALFVAVGGIVALFLVHDPWLLPIWLFVIPLTAAIVCWAARARIRNSEGTLAGLAFTSWGINLSLFVALIYGAYYASTYFAITQQADGFAGQFLDRLKKGEVDQAFLLTLKPPRPAAQGEELRNELEVAYNSGPRGRTGAYGSFRRADFVHLFLAAAGEAQVRPLGVADWEYDKGAYRVEQHYQVSTPAVQFDMAVTLIGQDDRRSGRGQKGRQWMVQIDNTGVLKGSMNPTEKGIELMNASNTARAFAGAWQQMVDNHQWDAAYLRTLPPPERQRQEAALSRCHLGAALAVTGPGPFALRDSACEDFLKGRQAFFKGDLVRADSFWAKRDQRQEIIDRVKGCFNPMHVARDRMFSLQQESAPLWQRVGDDLCFYFTFQLNILNPEKQAPEWSIEGRYVVAVDARQAFEPSPPWRLAAVELLNARTPPPQMPPAPR